jgi:hypothetical protein
MLKIIISTISKLIFSIDHFRNSRNGSHFLYHLLLVLNFFTVPCLSINFQIPRFKSSDTNIIYQGSAAVVDGEVNFNINELYSCQVGRAIYSK